jgi:UDP-glucose 4-epimerase
MADGTSRLLVTDVAGFIGRRPVRAASHSGPLTLGSDESVTVNDIVEAARSVTGTELPAEHVPPERGEMPAVIIDIAAARSPGYASRFDLKAGIATVWPEFSETAK